MMLDNKNEQKWPLTEKSSKEQTVKGHFFCTAAVGGGIFYALLQSKRKVGHLPPNIFIISYREKTVNNYLNKNNDFRSLHQLNGTFLESFRGSSCFWSLCSFLLSNIIGYLAFLDLDFFAFLFLIFFISNFWFKN